MQLASQLQRSAREPQGSTGGFQAEKSLGVHAACLCDGFRGLTHGGGQSLENVWQESWFVAAVARFFGEIPGQEVGCVGLDEHSIEGEVAHSILQRCASTLVAEPARNSDIQIQIEIRAKLI